MRIMFRAIPAVVLILVSWVGFSPATLITNSAGFQNPAIIDFSQYSTCSFGSVGCSPPLNIDGLVGEVVSFTGTPGFLGASAYNALFGLETNGFWDSGRNGFVGINNGQGTTGVFARFTFVSGLVSAVGAFENYSPGVGGTPIIRALGLTGQVLEQYDLSLLAPIATPGGVNQGAFRGIVRLTNDIAAIEYVDGFQAVDNLTFSRSVIGIVAEPPAVFLTVIAWAAIVVCTRAKPYIKRGGNHDM
jgi:hypothetical protein